MRWMLLGVFAVLFGCAMNAISPKVEAAPMPTADCPNDPALAATGFRHTRSSMIAKLGSPRHRGIDLIAAEGDENQTLAGKLAYTKADKDLEDEEVEIFACIAKKWASLGTARTDDDGRFALTLAGKRRLPIGMTDLYAHVRGDASGARFLGFVAAKGESVIVSDIDGTITSSEDAIFKTVLLGKDIAPQPDASQAFAMSGKTVVYVSARGDQLTDVTRAWLARHGFPRGPLRLAPSIVTLPGKRTARLKTATLDALPVPIAAAIGNRASDIVAYTNAGLSPDRIFINLPEFTQELRNRLDRGEATPFDHYADLVNALRR